MSTERNLIDETFDLNKSKQYILSILLKKNGLSFVVLDNTIKKVIVWKEHHIEDTNDLEDYSFSLKKILRSDDLLNMDYQSIKVIFQSDKSISIPNDLYSEQHIESFVKLHLLPSVDDQVLVNDINVIGAKKVYLVKRAIFEIFDNHFKKWTSYHSSLPVLEYALTNAKEDRIYFALNSNFFEIQIVSNQNLVLDNTFVFKEKEDVLYYLLYIFEQLNIEPSKVDMLAFLSEASDHKIIDFIGEYISKITLAAFPKSYSQSYLLTKDLSPFIASQIHVFSCE